MSKRQGQALSQVPPKKPAVAGLSGGVLSGPPSDYRQFLNTFIVGKQPANFDQTTVDSWPEPDVTTDKGLIANEIAKKFINTNRLGIKEVGKKDSSASLASYWGLPVSLTLPSLPEPSTIGHELVHANDHQYDNLNAKIWGHVKDLYDKSGKDSKNFGQSLDKIRNKIDPTGAFSQGYKQDFTRQPIVKDINAWRGTQQPPVPALNPPGWSNTKSTPQAPVDNWGATFQAIPPVVTDTDPVTNVQNLPFFLGGPSEFPAFMSEKLSDRWYPADGGKAALQLPEARFLHSTLGDMDAAYPSTDSTGAPAYPTMNQHIKARRNSLEQAYYPPNSSTNPMGGPPGGVFSRGGRVTGKNLLSRFKKI